jgi:hypothetical protein
MPLRPICLLPAATLVLLAACSGSGGTEQARGPDAAGETACDNFARYVRDGQPRAGRAEVIRTVAADARASGSGRLADAVQLLENAGPVSTDGAWKLAADGFAQACFDAGWDG